MTPGVKESRARCVAGGVLVAGLCACSLIYWGGPAGIAEDVQRSGPAQASVNGSGESFVSSAPARLGLVPWSGPGPRAPANDVEKRLAQIPDYHPEEDLLFFSHIHKTSGTSLSCLLANIFPRNAVVPTSQPSMGLKVDQVSGHDEEWWGPYQVMYSHNRPNITETIGVPATKTPRLLVTVRNPLLHKASIYFESVCRYGLHIKNGTIDQEEATVARMEGKTRGSEQFAFCRDPELWVGSRQFATVYRNFESNWLSYGAADRHPCIMPSPEVNMWRQGKLDADGSCDALTKEGKEEDVWEEYFERTADAAIRRMEGALWVGVTERMEEAACLLFLTLGKKEREMEQYRLKIPRPVSVWGQAAREKAESQDRADWRVFDAANNILDLRLWTARERLENMGDEGRERLGDRCFDLLTKTSP